MAIDSILIVTVLIAGLYMLWNIGANDVANAMGTSVGSKALTLKNAVIVAAVLEFLGAFILGGNVTETIQSGIVNPQMFDGRPMVFILGMLSSLIATAVWLQIATFFRWPVSTTHAIVGAVLGFGILIGGVEAVDWSCVGSIALSWVISPLLSGLLAFFVFTYVQKTILYSICPVSSTMKIAPYLLSAVLLTVLISLGSNGIKNLHLDLSIGWVLLGSFGVALLAFLAAKLFFRFPFREGMSIQISDLQGEQLDALYKANKYLTRFKSIGKEPHVSEVNAMMTNVKAIAEELKTKKKEECRISMEYQIVEKIFAYLQIVSACCVAFAHGSNDVANAVGPVAAVLEMIRHPDVLHGSTPIPLWLLAFGPWVR
jgi:phosphate/sulfate permease